MRELALNEIRHIQLEILKAVASHCRNHGITYSLGYGTLIGAIRHRGYIPWDDDIDIVMPRPDYDRFVRSFDGAMENLKVYAPELDSEFPYPFAKVSNENTVVIENVIAKSAVGVNIDVFPIDGIALTDKYLLRRQTFLCRLRALKSIKARKGRSITKNVALLLGRFMLFWLPIEVINMRMVKAARKYSFEHEDYCCSIATGTPSDNVWPKKYFEQYSECVFEGEVFAVTEFYDKWLTSVYGDFMTPPPRERRVSHHDFKAYSKTRF